LKKGAGVVLCGISLKTAMGDMITPEAFKRFAGG
jgi:hypothetical protein